ncbi:MAG TPA: PAS domain-containing sensor histidine kinase, partial [Rhodocyclaceae bacterium]|nr:PAS domain-containing sensor histidine kinase [Rhodocyclaceae bacterium]
MFEGSIAFASQDPELYYLVAAGYALVAVYLLASSMVSPTRARDLMGPVTLDILALTLLMHASGGAKSELGYMLFVPLAAAGLIGEGRTTLFFAALATVAVLLEQAYRSSGRGGG